MSLFVIASLITAFVAGMAALFAPCCISVLLPAYLGSIFRERYKVVAMTFIFFLGVLTVFLPLGFGFSAMAQLFKEYHNTLFIIGGIFLTVLGVMILTKKSFAMPFSLHPNLKKHNAGSIYVLGIFSGAATTCCAPVLAGVMALSVIPGSVVWGAVYSFMYSLGMVTPLFAVALFMDKTKINKKLMSVRKSLTFNLGKKTVSYTVSELISGLMFLIMGLVIVYYAFANKLAMHNDYQVSINIYFARMQETILSVLASVPLFVWIAALTFLFYGAIKVIFNIINYFKKNENE